MARSVEEKITVYRNHFSKVIDRVSSIELQAESQTFKKVLFVSIIDALSRSVSGHSAGNRARFTGVVSEFGDWSDRNRISAPQLKILLDQLPSREFDEARKFISKLIERNSTGRLVPLSDDPENNSLGSIWPVGTDAKVWEQVSLNALTHVNLLYQFRCTLVHEFREPGYGMEFSGDRDAPYYHGMTTIDDRSNPKDFRLELVYPTGFFQSMARRILANLDTHFRKNSIDPYESYVFGSSWHALPST